MRIELIIALAAGVAACGPKNKADAPQATSTDAGADAEAVAAEDESKPVEHPFAKNPQETLSLVTEAIEKKRSGLLKCVGAYRDRVKDATAKVSVKIGVDQEGTLIGVSPSKSGELDRTLTDCMQVVLRRAPFPKSHSGVISVVRDFEFGAMPK